MRTIARTHAHAARDNGTRGFIVWIAAYAVFMLALIAFNSGSQLITHPLLAWPSFPGIS